MNTDAESAGTNSRNGKKLRIRLLRNAVHAAAEHRG